MAGKYQSTIDALRQLKCVLADGWCQGARARNKEGEVVFPQDKDACSWCMYGGLQRLNLSPKVTKDCVMILGDTCHALYGCDMVTFNDMVTTDKAMVMMLISDAIAVLEEDDRADAG